MEAEHRKLIEDNIEKLVAKTELQPLMTLCVQNGFISGIMRDNLIKSYASNEERHRQLFIKITKRGPKAFHQLFEILKAGFPGAEQVLGEGVISIHESKKKEGYQSKHGSEMSSPTIESNERLQDPEQQQHKNYDDDDGKPIKLEKYKEPTTHDDSIIVEKSKDINFDKRVDTYPMRSKYRGVFLLVNIINFPNSERRNGATIDRENLIYLFREFGYDVFYYEDLVKSQFEQILAALLTSKYTRRTESFVMAILTHGEMKGGKEYIEFRDGAVMNLADIVQCFSNNNCSNLYGKPKIFIFPFCRGTVSDQGTYADYSRNFVQTDGISRTLNIPSLSDIIIFYASVPGFKTHRDPLKGSWYVQVMCKVWAKHAHDTDLETLEKKVGEETLKIRAGDKLQTSSRVTYGFNKALYFNPGFYQDK